MADFDFNPGTPLRQRQTHFRHRLEPAYRDRISDFAAGMFTQIQLLRSDERWGQRGISSGKEFGLRLYKTEGSGEEVLKIRRSIMTENQ